MSWMSVSKYYPTKYLQTHVRFLHCGVYAAQNFPKSYLLRLIMDLHVILGVLYGLMDITAMLLMGE
jgi:hypothetical protein